MAPYQRGDIIMQCDAFVYGPAADIAGKDIKKFTCWTCHRSASAFILGESACVLKRCAQCRHVAYCSKECQTRDWLALHRLECPYLVRTCRRSDLVNMQGQLFLWNDERFLARCLLRLGDARDSDAESFERFFRLPIPVRHHLFSDNDNMQCRNAFRPDIGAERIRVVRRLLAGHAYTRSLSNKEICQIDLRLQSAATAGSFHKSDMWGSFALFLPIARLAQSCRPNASAVMRQDGRMYLLANESIASDAAIRIACVDTVLPTADVRPSALDRYFKVDCRCSQCDATMSEQQDQYRRSNRCLSAIDGSTQCQAPCPMTRDLRPAVEFCSNGHAQQYSVERDAEFRQAYKRIIGDIRRFDAPTPDESQLRVLFHYWHPINTTILQLEAAISSTPQHDRRIAFLNALNGALTEYGLAAMYGGGRARGLVAQYERLVVPGGDAYALFCCLHSSVLGVSYGLLHVAKAPRRIRRETERAVVDLLSECVPLAERYLGEESRCARALRWSGAFAPGKLVHEVERMYRAASGVMAMAISQPEANRCRMLNNRTMRIDEEASVVNGEYS